MSDGTLNFSLEASWAIFATKYGKSPHNAIGRTLKRSVCKDSLQNSAGSELNTTEMFLNFVHLTETKYIFQTNKERREFKNTWRVN